MDGLLVSLGLDAPTFALVCAAAFAGALVQGAIGFGLNLVVAPVIAAFRPEALPASAIILALPMTLGSAAREHAHIDRAAILWTTLGRLPGIGLGVLIVTLLDSEALALAIGAMVLLAVAMSMLSLRVPIHRGTQAAAGFLGGVMGTASSIGGPPLALLYQHAPGPVVRSTLGASFLVGTGLSLLALGLAGQVTAQQVRLGLALVPPVLLGLWASRALHAWLDRGWLRPAVLAVAFASGATVLLRGLLSR